MSTQRNQRKHQASIYATYRRIFRRTDLTDKEIDAMRNPVILLAQAICEHVWEKKFF